MDNFSEVAKKENAQFNTIYEAAAFAVHAGMVCLGWNRIKIAEYAKKAHAIHTMFPLRQACYERTFQDADGEITTDVAEIVLSKKEEVGTIHLNWLKKGDSLFDIDIEVENCIDKSTLSLPHDYDKMFKNEPHIIALLAENVNKPQKMENKQIDNKTDAVNKSDLQLEMEYKYGIRPLCAESKEAKSSDLPSTNLVHLIQCSPYTQIVINMEGGNDTIMGQKNLESAFPLPEEALPEEALPEEATVHHLYEKTIPSEIIQHDLINDLPLTKDLASRSLNRKWH